MKKKHAIFRFLYYALTIVVYTAFFYMASLMLDLTGKADNLGSVMAVTYGVLFPRFVTKTMHQFPISFC